MKVAEVDAQQSPEIILNDKEIGFHQWVIDTASRNIRIVNPVAVASGAEVHDEYPHLLVRRPNGEAITIRYATWNRCLMTVGRGAGDWRGMSTRGQLRVHSHRVNGQPSEVVRLRSDEQVR